MFYSIVTTPRTSELLCRGFQHDIEDAGLKSLAIHIPLFNCNCILDAIHRIVLVRVALKMDLSNELLISRADGEQVEMCAAPEIRRPS